MSDFQVPACANCGHAIWPPRLACPVCGAAEWTEVPAPTGTLLDVTEAPGYDGTRSASAPSAWLFFMDPRRPKGTAGRRGRGRR